MPESCRRHADAITTSESRAAIPWSATIAGATPRRSSRRKIRSATFRTIWTWTQEWSDIPSRSAVVCWTSHHALSWSSALAASMSAWSLRLPRAGARRRISAVSSRGVLSTDQPLEEVAGLARVDAVLALVTARLPLVGQRQHELLARRAEVACDLVERHERCILHHRGGARRSRQRALPARVRDLDRLRRDGRVEEDVSHGHGRGRHREPLECSAPSLARQDGDGGDRGKHGRDDERKPERVGDRCDERVVRARGEAVVGSVIGAGELASVVRDRTLEASPGLLVAHAREQVRRERQLRLRRKRRVESYSHG